jgi:hypothetical protein
MKSKLWSHVDVSHVTVLNRTFPQALGSSRIGTKIQATTHPFHILYSSLLLKTMDTPDDKFHYTPHPVSNNMYQYSSFLVSNSYLLLGCGAASPT